VAEQGGPDPPKAGLDDGDRIGYSGYSIVDWVGSFF